MYAGRQRLTSGEGIWELFSLRERVEVGAVPGFYTPHGSDWHIHV